MVDIVEQYPRLVDFVLSDHVHVHVLYKHLVQATADNKTPLVSKLANAIMLLVRQHSQAELDVLYPAIAADLGPLGQSLAAKALEEHAQVEEMIKKALQASPKEAALIVKEFCDVRKKDVVSLPTSPRPPQVFFVHAEEEEKEMVPALIAKEPSSKQEQIVQNMVQAKANAPFEPQIPSKEN